MFNRVLKKSINESDKNMNGLLPHVRPLFLIFLTSSSICLSFDFIISSSFVNFIPKIYITWPLPRPVPWVYRYIYPYSPAIQPPPSLSCFNNPYPYAYLKVYYFFSFFFSPIPMVILLTFDTLDETVGVVPSSEICFLSKYSNFST